jgi:hypothetical protein
MTGAAECLAIAEEDDATIARREIRDFLLDAGWDTVSSVLAKGSHHLFRGDAHSADVPNG